MKTTWIDDYLKYTQDTESTELFNKWVAISAISAALSKKAYLKLGRLNLFANMYVVLVADPGVARKTQSISYMTKLITQDSNISLSSTSTTIQALLESLEESIKYVRMPSGEIFRYASLCVISKEFEVFFGVGAGKALPILTDMFDCEFEPWSFRTKSFGNVTLPSVYLSILAATTPQSLSSCLSDLVIGGGLTSRILFICSRGKSKKVAFPSWSDELRKMQEVLTSDLVSISEMTGEFSFSKEAREAWEIWYVNNDDSVESRIAKDKRFDGWYSRKSLHILKTAMCVSAARSIDMEITLGDLQKAVEYIEEVERNMGDIFLPEIQRSVTGGSILSLLERRGTMSEMQLRHSLWRDMGREEFYETVSTLVARGLCEKLEKNGETYYRRVE